MSEQHRARTVQIAFGVAGVIAIALAIAWLRRPSPYHVQPEKPSVSQAGERDVSLGQTPLVGEVRGTDDVREPAPPPVVFAIGPSDPNQAVDLNTPAQAVYSVLELLNRSEMETLSRCFSEKAPAPSESLYPRYLGQPVELVDVIEEGETAKVVWNATVRTAFSLDGVSRPPGETMTLTTSLIRVDGLWKLVKLHDGGDWDEISAN